MNVHHPERRAEIRLPQRSIIQPIGSAPSGTQVGEPLFDRNQIGL
jgi:hypothetical protein